jgi:hypothetical protein
MMPSLRSSASIGRLLLLAPVAILAACGSDDSTGPGQENPVVTSVVVAPQTATLTSLGETVQLSASVRDQNGNEMSGQTVTWASDPPAVATVDASGQVTAVANGQATVTASSSGKSGSAAVTVDVRGSVLVSATTTGEPGAIDPDGYSVDVGGISSTVESNGEVEVTGVPLGEVTVTIGSIASNCQAVPDASVTITVTAD